MTSRRTIKSILESMLFVWGEPLDPKLAAEVFQLPWKEVHQCLVELAEDYEKEERGITIREIDGKFQFVTRPEHYEYIEKLCSPVKEKRLSQAALEVLAIIAYRQPVTKGEIESIRGIKSDRAIEGLTKRGIVEEAGRSQAIGRPILYRTTPAFLENFGFRNLDDLPSIEDISTLVQEEDGLEGPDALEFQQISLDMEA